MICATLLHFINVTHTHTHTHTLTYQRLGTIWGSVSCPMSLQHADRSWEQTHWPLWFLGDLSHSCLLNKGHCGESHGQDRWFVIFHKDACEPAVLIIHVMVEQSACDQMELTVFQKRHHLDSFSHLVHTFFSPSVFLYIYTACKILLILTKKHTV